MFAERDHRIAVEGLRDVVQRGLWLELQRPATRRTATAAEEDRQADGEAPSRQRPTAGAGDEGMEYLQLDILHGFKLTLTTGSRRILRTSANKEKPDGHVIQASVAGHRHLPRHRTAVQRKRGTAATGAASRPDSLGPGSGRAGPGPRRRVHRAESDGLQRSRWIHLDLRWQDTRRMGR